MTRTYFGTDGIRGTVGQPPITPDFVLRLAHAVGRVLKKSESRPTVLIGKDTRVSGYMLEAALESGFSAAGVDVMLAGPMPTPGIAYLTRALRLALVIVGLGAAVFLASWQFFSPIQDEMAFSEAKKHGAQGYRDYLLDDRNTRHRDEAKAKIKELYQPVIAMAATCPDATERQGWTDLLTSLSDDEGLPAVSLAVSEEGEAKSPEREKLMRTWLADSLGSKFGPAFVGFVEPPPEAKQQAVQPDLQVLAGTTLSVTIRR